MTEQARLALTKVRVDGKAANIFVYDDRFVVSTDDAEQVFLMTQLDRVATRKSWRGARLLLAWDTGHVMKVRRLSAASASAAHRTIVGIARELH